MNSPALGRALLVAGIVGASFGEAVAAGPWTLEVRAGGSARRETPVRWELPEGQDASGDWRLVSLDGGAEVAVQIEAAAPELGTRPAAVWIVEEEIPAGGSRRYRLERKTSWAFATRVTVADLAPGRLVVRNAGRDVLVYNHATIEPPEKVEPIYARSGYIHPLFSPEGKLVTNDFPLHHKHHHGIWMPWSQTVFEGRPTNFWEQARGEGKVESISVEARPSGPVFGGVRARLRFTDLRAPGGPKPALDETWDVRVWALDGCHLIDFVSVQECAGPSPVVFKEYLYGGFGFRGSKDWEGEQGVAFLTSEGKTRPDGHATKARWCDLVGRIGGAPVGIAFLCHPSNCRSPQGMRIHPSEPFFNFAPCQDGDFELRPGERLVSRYRIFVRDGGSAPEEVERLWKDYGNPPEVRRTDG